ncbi:MAG: YggS family pyridoxal phosphate-dependent enzyme [Candidatus Adiutrix sp.]|nr:YggS family pyridoxal phosphate-dependent enzyme [Candidatus Adiutrix sp.]
MSSIIPNLSPAEALERLRAIRETAALAAERAGRAPESVTLLGVGKTVPAAVLRVFAEAGLRDFGESYLQEARAKMEELADLYPAPRWHFIGHLQTNKAKAAAALFPVIHSLDRLELARELDARARALGRTIEAYIEVNVSGEDSKSGLAPAALPRFLEDLAALPALKPLGLMTMPPYDPDPEASRPFFAALRELKDRLAPGLPGLSMGMSGDFAVAIEEGATIIRVGTALFGRRASRH